MLTILSTEGRLGKYSPDPMVFLGWVALCLFEGITVGVYLFLSSGRVTDPLVFTYPFIWVNASIWAVGRRRAPPTTANRRLVARLIAGGYFLVLAFFGGILAFEGMGSPGVSTHWSLPPGYGPQVVLSSPQVQLLFVPYKVVGYLALAYLVYTVLLDTFSSALTGVVGIFSCVSCTWPILGTFLTTLFGSTSMVVSVASNQPYGASTVVFLSAVALLTWRPGSGPPMSGR